MLNAKNINLCLMVCVSFCELLLKKPFAFYHSLTAARGHMKLLRGSQMVPGPHFGHACLRVLTLFLADVNKGSVGSVSVATGTVKIPL